MRTYDTRSYEAAYLAGLVAGSMTRSGLPGVAGALPTPAVLLGIMRSRWAPGRRTRPCARGRNNE